MRRFTLLKSLFLAAVLAVGSGSAWGQGVETFSNFTRSSGSYGTQTWTGDNGMTWTAEDARTDQDLTGDAICIRQTKGKLTGLLNEAQKSAGVGVITFNAKNSAASSDGNKSTTYKFTCGSKTATVEIDPMGSNNVVKVTSPVINSQDAESIVIEITAEKGVRVTIDDLEWTAYTDPAQPIITTDMDELAFNEVVVGSNVEQQINVSGANLTGSITVAVTGNGFAVTPQELEATGGVLTVSYNPTALGESTGTLTLTSGETTATVALSGNAVLGTPAALDAENVTANSFVAKWEELDGATSYSLDVYSGEVFLAEAFDNMDGTGGNDGEWSGSIASAPASATDFPGWEIERVYKANGCIKLGSSSNAGSITTPALGLDGNATLTFRAGAWNKDNTTLSMAISGGGELAQSTVEMKNNEFTEYSIVITNGTENTQITFSGSERFFLDDIMVDNLVRVDGYPQDVTGTSHEVTGLTPATEYSYAVTAKANEETSPVSNEISVTTLNDEGPGTGIASVTLDGLYAVNGTIYFNAVAGERVEVINTLGQCVYAGATVDGLNSVAVEAGIVVVKVGNSVGKVVVK